MGNRVFIDGTEYTGQVEGIEDFTVTYASDSSSKTVTASTSSSLTFYKDAYIYLKSKFFDTGIAGRDSEVEVRIVTDCCADDYTFIVRGDAVEICFDECTINTQGFERTDDQKASDKIRQYRILQKDSDLVLSFTPKVRYCQDAGFVSIALYALFLSLVGFFNVIGAILSVFNINALSNLIDNIAASILGCSLPGAGLRMFYLKDIFEDIASNAGLTPVSSVLQNDVYKDACWLDVTNLVEQNTGYNPRNRDHSNLFADEWLDILEKVFNAQWQIRSGVLYFERKDFFLSTDVTLINVEEAYNNNKAELPCYTFTDVPKWAYGRFSYTQDSGDRVSDRALPHFFDIVEFNDPFDPTKRGRLEVEIPLSPTHFVGDSFSSWPDWLYNIQNSPLLGFFAPPVRPFKALIVESDGEYIRRLPKIIMVRPISANNPEKFDVITSSKIVQIGTDNVEVFNHEMSLIEGYSDSLLEKFWRIEDPRLTSGTPYTLEEFTFLADCEKFELVRQNGTALNVVTQLGIGIPEEIELNYNDSTITVKNVRIKA